MTHLYEPSLYTEELPFSKVEVGRVFPGYQYSITQAHIDAYAEAVSTGAEGPPIAEALRSPLLSTLVAINYGFIYSAMCCRPPTGFLNSTVRIELLDTVHVGEPLAMSVTVADKHVKRERNHVLLDAAVTRGDGSCVARARVGCIFP